MNEDLKLHKDHILEAHKLLDNIKWRIANKTFADLDKVRETLKIVRGELIPLLEKHAIELVILQTPKDDPSRWCKKHNRPTSVYTLRKPDSFEPVNEWICPECLRESGTRTLRA